MSSTTASASEGVARQALEKNLRVLWSRFGRGEGCVLHEEEGARFFDTPIPTLPYNAVLRFSVDSDVDRRIDSILEHDRRRDVPFLWLVHPTARPSDLGERLGARGLGWARILTLQALHASGTA